MDTPPPAPPYGILIEVARKGARLSLRRAAELAGVSKATWIDNARGYRKRDNAWEPVNPKPETIARMAHAAAVSAKRLESEGGNPAAAQILREIERPQTPVPPLSAVPDPPALPDSGTVSDEVIGLLLEKHPDREFLAKLWAVPQSRDERLVLLRGWLHRDDPEEPGRGRSTGPGA
jgi:hypothetical protein